jgi:hypothetical protein
MLYFITPILQASLLLGAVGLPTIGPRTTLPDDFIINVLVAVGLVNVKLVGCPLSNVGCTIVPPFHNVKLSFTGFVPAVTNHHPLQSTVISFSEGYAVAKLFKFINTVSNPIP